jgi:hypothetical protein
MHAPRRISFRIYSCSKAVFAYLFEGRIDRAALIVKSLTVSKRRALWAPRASTGHPAAIVGLKCGNPMRPLELVRAILDEAPDDPEPIFLRGFAYAEMSDTDKAIATLENWVKLPTHHSLARSFLNARGSRDTTVKNHVPVRFQNLPARMNFRNDECVVLFW